MKAKLVIGVVALQALVLAFMAGEREWVLHTGRTLYLRTAPVDPRDAMRGDYVRLNYDFSRVPRALCRGALAGTNGTFETVRPDSKVYALLRQEEDGVAELVSLSSERPPEGLFLRGRTEKSWGGNLQVHYGIEAFFVQQDKGKELEAIPERDAVRVPLEVRVALGRSGLAVLKDYRRAALGIGLQVETRLANGTNDGRVRPVGATLRLFNASSNDLALVDLPGGCSLALVPDSQWEANPWRWTREQEAQPVPEAAQVILLKPGESHSFKVGFDDPAWSVVKEEKGTADKSAPRTLSNLTQEWSGRFRFEYRAPSRAACTNLPHAALIWHGRLASRAFNTTGGID